MSEVLDNNIPTREYPFGSIEKFYEMCVFGNSPIPDDFKTDFSGTVNFYKQLKHFFNKEKGEFTKGKFSGIFSPFVSPMVNNFMYWDGNDIINWFNGDKRSMRTMWSSTQLFYNVGNDDENKISRYITRLPIDKRIKNDIVLIDDLNDKVKYKVSTYKVVNNKESFYYLTINYDPSYIEYLTIDIPYEVGEEQPLNVPNSFNFMDYNNNNPIVIPSSRKSITAYYGNKRQGVIPFDEESFNSLGIDFSVKYTKEELKDLGLNIFLSKKLLELRNDNIHGAVPSTEG